MHRLHHGLRVVGTKQTLKALNNEKVALVFIADDASPFQVDPVISRAKELGVDIVYVPTMNELGIACEVEVRTATAALINNN